MHMFRMYMFRMYMLTHLGRSMSYLIYGMYMFIKTHKQVTTVHIKHQRILNKASLRTHICVCKHPAWIFFPTIRRTPPERVSHHEGPIEAP